MIPYVPFTMQLAPEILELITKVVGVISQLSEETWFARWSV